MPDDLDEATIALAALVGDHDTVRGLLALARAEKSDSNHGGSGYSAARADALHRPQVLDCYCFSGRRADAEVPGGEWLGGS